MIFRVDFFLHIDDENSIIDKGSLAQSLWFGKGGLTFLPVL